MNLQNATSKELICLNCDFSTKLEAIQFLIDKLDKAGKLKGKEAFFKSVLEREDISATGIDMGLAVPHGKSNAVREAAFAVATVKTPIKDWKSIVEGNQVSVIFLLAIPEDEAGSTHLALLSELMTRVSDPAYLEKIKKAKTSEELYDILGENGQSEQTTEENYSKTIAAVTACPAGIAHTYMAAEALVKAGEELGVKVYVEKQGANGVEDRHTSEILKHADAAIFATDVAVKDSGRFSHLPVYKTKVAAPLKDAKGVIQAALKKAEKEGKTTVSQEVITENEGKETVASEIKKAVLTGISYIIPIIIAGGMINAFAVLIAQGFGLQELYNMDNSWLWLFRKMGGNTLGTLMIPMLAAYMAYSLGDKTALAPGFAAGVAANLINGGFLCGMLGGLAAGYSIRFLRKAIPAKGVFAGFISFWVYPVAGTLFVGIVMFFILGKPVAWLNQALIRGLSSLSGSNAAVLGAILGIMVSFDLGGPVNKAAYTFCVGAMSDGILMPYAAFASIKMVSAFAVTMSTLGFKKYFTKEEQEAGMSTWILGLAGITEGAIPVMMADPVRVIFALCAGSAVTGAIVATCNIGLDVPGAGIFSMFLLKDGMGGLTNALIWFFAAVLGAVISTIILIILKKQKMNRIR
jgi:2-O-A-mannosyl-D-glycerate PTS system EIIABC component